MLNNHYQKAYFYKENISTLSYNTLKRFFIRFDSVKKKCVHDGDIRRQTVLTQTKSKIDVPKTNPADAPAKPDI